MKIEITDNNFIVDGKIVNDELELPFAFRTAFREFKKKRASGLKIQSSEETTKKNKAQK